MVLGEVVPITINHKKGSVDKNGVYYPINVGYIYNPTCKNEKQIVYLLGAYDPVDSYNGEFLAYVCSKGDDDRIVCGNFSDSYSDDQILSQIDFIDRYSSVVRPCSL